MPLDPSIILGATNINAEAQKIQAAQTATAEQQNQLRLQNYAVAQAKQDFQDQQNLKQAWRQANGDPTQTLAIAAKLGVSPKAVTAFQQQQLQVQSLLDTHNKTVAETGKTSLDTMIARNDEITGHLQPLADAKTPVEFQTKLPQVIQSLKGLATDDEINQLAGATQQQVQDFITGHQSVKAHAALLTANAAVTKAGAAATDAQVNAEKQANEGAGQVLDTNKKKLNGAATTLANAYNAGGAVAYNKALQQFNGDELINGSMPTSDQIAKMSPADALKAINYAGMDSNQRQQATQAQATLDNTKAYQAQEIALRKQSTAIQQQMLGLDITKTAATLFQAGLGPDGKPLADNDKTLLTPVTQNTSDGRTFIDQDTALKGLPKGQQLQLKNAAASAGIPMLAGKEAAAVRDVDNARNTINAVFSTFMQTAGAGSSGIALKIPQAVGNFVAAKSGINPQLDAASKNFIAAIETMKSAGGQGSGLRITGAEIQRIGSLMPKFGDTQEQLQAKAQQINTLMNDKLGSALHHVPVTNASSGSAQSSIPSGAMTASGQGGQKIFSTDGGNTWFDSATKKRIQ